MNRVTMYKGVQIYESYGFYTAGLDFTIESRDFGDILQFIDNSFNVQQKVAIDYYILQNFSLSQPFLNN